MSCSNGALAMAYQCPAWAWCLARQATALQAWCGYRLLLHMRTLSARPAVAAGARPAALRAVGADRQRAARNARRPGQAAHRHHVRDRRGDRGRRRRPHRRVGQRWGRMGRGRPPHAALAEVLGRAAVAAAPPAVTAVRVRGASAVLLRLLRRVRHGQAGAERVGGHEPVHGGPGGCAGGGRLRARAHPAQRAGPLPVRQPVLLWRAPPAAPPSPPPPPPVRACAACAAPSAAPTMSCALLLWVVASVLVHGLQCRASTRVSWRPVLDTDMTNAGGDFFFRTSTETLRGAAQQRVACCAVAGGQQERGVLHGPLHQGGDPARGRRVRARAGHRRGGAGAALPRAQGARMPLPVSGFRVKTPTSPCSFNGTHLTPYLCALWFPLGGALHC